jgi:hypothetical protein
LLSIATREFTVKAVLAAVHLASSRSVDSCIPDIARVRLLGPFIAEAVEELA